MDTLPAVLRTGLNDIDEQHAHLLRWADALVKDDPDAPPEERKRAFVFLLFYTASHFAAEEDAMHTHGYPAIEAHCARHVAFRGQVAALRREVEAHGLDQAAARRIYQLVVDWLPRHVAEYDTPLSLFLARTRATLTPLPEVEDLLEDNELPAWMERVIEGMERDG
jgi:hemerythrin-like metal-binding protein